MMTYSEVTQECPLMHSFLSVAAQSSRLKHSNHSLYLH